jgi:hypothetical protein
MKDLYIKDKNGNFVPIKLELVSQEDFANKMVLITVGNDKYDADTITLEHIRESFVKSEVIIDAMRRSISADLLIIPHSIKFELFSKDEIETKNVYIRVDKNDNIDNLPEIKAQIKKSTGKDANILPSTISIKEYKEIKAIKERTKIRKERYGGGALGSK